MRSTPCVLTKPLGCIRKLLEFLYFSAMEGPFLDRWQVLCKLVAEEKDRERLSQLVQELLDELRKKEELLNHPAKGSAA
jgi:hypothetical protein